MTTKRDQWVSTAVTDPIEAKRGKRMGNTLAFRKIRLAVAAIDGGAKKMGISGREMYERLNRQGLVHSRLLGCYEQLHTQSEEWVVEDAVETLKNWEAMK